MYLYFCRARLEYKVIQVSILLLLKLELEARSTYRRLSNFYFYTISTKLAGSWFASSGSRVGKWEVGGSGNGKYISRLSTPSRLS